MSGFWGDAERREAARSRFERRMAIPVLVAAALLTAVTLALLLADLSSGARRALLAVDLLIWVFFVIDYVVRFTLATPKWPFVRREWVDLVLVVLPLLQPLRLLGALFRVARISAAWQRAATTTVQLTRHKLHIALAWSAALVLIAAVITPLVESRSRARSRASGTASGGPS
jgi:voltage-gated potassium channel